MNSALPVAKILLSLVRAMAILEQTSGLHSPHSQGELVVGVEYLAAELLATDREKLVSYPKLKIYYNN